MSGANSPQGGLTRRSFLKTTGVVAGAAAVSGGMLGCSLVATSEDAGVSGSDVQTFTSRCIYCFECHQKISVRDDKIVGVQPASDHGDERGNRPCLKGYGNVMHTYSQHRIRYPMRRIGERGSGEWERISWDEAIDEIVLKWKEYAEEYGPTSIMYAGSGAKAFYLNGAYGLPARFKNAMGASSADLCVDLAICFGVGRSFGGSGYYMPGAEDTSDVLNADTIIYWGVNVPNAYPSNWRFTCDAREKGIVQVCVDPTYTPVAKASDIWVSIRPGTDLALMLGMINWIYQNEKYDADYIRKSTTGPCLVRRDTKTLLRMKDLGVEDESAGNQLVTWDEASGAHAAIDAAVGPAIFASPVVSGIETDTVCQLMADYCKEFTLAHTAELTGVPEDVIEKVAELSCTGKVKHANSYGSQTYDNGVHMGMAIAHILCITGMMGKSGTSFMYPMLNTPANYANMFATYDIKASSVPLLELPNVMKSGAFKGKPYPIKMLFSQGSNMFCMGADQNEMMKEVLPKLEYIVVADFNFHDTANLADIVLPVCMYYEYEDINPFKGSLYIIDKCIEPIGESKTDGEICRLLADKLGIGHYFSMTDEEMLSAALDIPALKSQGITLERLRKEKAIDYSGTTEEYPKISNASGKFDTPSGRAELYFESPKARVDIGQELDVDRERFPHWFPPMEAWPEHDIMKKYPFILTSIRSRHRFHTGQFANEWHTEISPEPTLRINNDDAAELGIVSGDYVEVFNDRGTAVAKAVVTAAMQPKMLAYPKGQQRTQFKSGYFSNLSSSQYDPAGMNMSFFDTAVGLRKWDGVVKNG